MTRFRIRLFSSLTFALIAGAQGQTLMDLKQMWRSQQYEALLPSLLSFRDSQPSFEVDYMLGTALCRVPRFTSDGTDYLNALLLSYRAPYYFDGQAVDLREAQRRYCPPPGVTASGPPLAGAGVQTMELRIRRTPAAIANDVKSKLYAKTGVVAAPVPPPSGVPPEFQGAYNMVHDGWRGTLTLTAAGGTYTDANGQRFPVRVGRAGGNYILFYVLGLGGENADNSGGQRFQGYLMTQTRDAIAGTTVWQKSTFGFYAIKR